MKPYFPSLIQGVEERRQSERERQVAEVKSLRAPTLPSHQKSTGRPPGTTYKRAGDIRRLHSEGKSDTEIAAAMGELRKDVTRIRAKLGLIRNEHRKEKP